MRTVANTRRRVLPLVLGVSVLLVVATAGLASAYWTRGGVGIGSARSATLQPINLGPATPNAQLYPGGTAGVVLTATNPNSATAHVVTLALDTTQGTGGYAVDSGHTGCTLSTLGFASQTNAGNGWNVPGNGSLSITLAGSLSMSTAAASACQGARFTVYLQATG